MLLAIDVGNTQTVIGLFGEEADGERRRARRQPLRGGAARPLAHRHQRRAHLATSSRCWCRSSSGFHGFRFDDDIDGIAISLGRAPRHRRVPGDDRALLRLPAGRDRARREDRHADPLRQPQRGRRRPHRQRGGRPRPLRRARRSSSTSARPRPSTPSPAKGEYLGGAIAPGIEISLDALFSRAAALRRVELVEPRNVIGRNTVESIQSGAVYGFAGQVDGICRRHGRRARRPCTVVATGGLAELIAPVHDARSSTSSRGSRCTACALIFEKQPEREPMDDSAAYPMSDASRTASSGRDGRRAAEQYADLEPGTETERTVDRRRAAHAAPGARASSPSARCRTRTGRIQLFAPADGDAATSTSSASSRSATGSACTRRGDDDPHAASCRCSVDEWTLLAEARRPFPDKWHGITDTDTRYRQRYVDLWVTDEARATLPAAQPS